MTHTQTKKYIYIALLCAQGIIIGLVERMIPFPFSFAPGAKLGLANLITIVSIFTMSKRDSFTLLWMRLIITALLGGTLSTFMYSAGGSLLSYLGMLGLKQLGPKRVSMIGISAVGGLLHNTGQLIVASMIAQSWVVMLYLPVLSFIGILAGTAVGIAANFLFLHIKTLSNFKNTYENSQQIYWKI